MNAKIAFTSIILAAGFAGNALADAEYFAVEPFVGSATRAEVRAELDAFRVSGNDPWAQGYDQTSAFISTANPAAVAAGNVQSRELVSAVMGSGSAHLAQSRLPGGFANVVPGIPLYEAP